MSCKRNQPEHDDSFEEKEIFRSSKLVIRSPGSERKYPNIKMDEIKALLKELRNDLKEDMRVMKEEIKDDIKEIKEDLKGMEKEIKQNREDMEVVKEEIKLMKLNWEKEKNEILEKLEDSDKKLEKSEKNKIRNNLVVSGIQISTQDEEEIKAEIENMIDKEIRVKAAVKKAYKIGQNKYIIKMNNWSDKIKILKEKNKMKGRDIFIDSDLTRQERNVQKILRDVAREEKNRGAIVKVRYQKIEINGKMWKWSHKEERLLEMSNELNQAKN